MLKKEEIKVRKKQKGGKGKRGKEKKNRGEDETGERENIREGSAGNSHAPFDRAGSGNGGYSQGIA